MNDFSYYNPTKIEFGKDKENNIGTYVKDAGITKILLLTGSSRVKESGVFDRVVASLNAAGVTYEELDGVVSNPLLSKVNEGVKIAKEKKVQAVLGLGGGSVADSAKAIAAGALYDGDVWDFFIQKASVTKALKVFTIMTLAATASEMNGNSVVMNDVTKQKYSVSSVLLNPVVSVVNPELMMSVTPEYLAYSAVDVIAHSIEIYFTASTHPHFNSRLVESIVKSVMETTEILMANPNDYDARAEFAWVSTQALNGLLPSGTAGGSFPNHMIEHALSAIYNVAHGAGLSIVIPAWMKWHKESNIKQYERFSHEVFGEKSADAGIQKLEAWFAKFGSPTTLKDANIPRDGILGLAQNANSLAKLWGMGDAYSIETIVEILEKA